MSRRMVSIFLLGAAAACTPQSAKLDEGTFTLFLSDSTSNTVAQGDVNWDKAKEEGDYTQVDCRDLSEENEDLRLPEADPAMCNAGTVNGVRHEKWINRGAFHVYQAPLDPWRGEGIMTSEGDLQVTFHQRIPGGKDMRFAFVLNPAFQPKRCVEQGEGVGYEEIDGNWLDSWSTTLAADDGEGNNPDWHGSSNSGTLYFINTFAYQFNPFDTADYWPLPDEWGAAFAHAKLSGELFNSRTVRYGKPDAYSAFELSDTEPPAQADLFFADCAAETDPSTDENYLDEADRVRQVAAESGRDFDILLGHTLADDPEEDAPRDYFPTVHTNQWRQPDGQASGLDCWVELHYSWVRLDQGPAEIAAKGEASGEFALLFDGDITQSRMLIQGKFTVPKIKKDHWVTKNLNEEKLEENGTEICGETFSSED